MDRASAMKFADDWDACVGSGDQSQLVLYSKLMRMSFSSFEFIIEIEVIQ